MLCLASWLCAGPALRAVQAPCTIETQTPYDGGCFCSHFTEEETEVQEMKQSVQGHSGRKWQVPRLSNAEACAPNPSSHGAGFGSVFIVGAGSYPSLTSKQSLFLCWTQFFFQLLDFVDLSPKWNHLFMSPQRGSITEIQISLQPAVTTELEDPTQKEPEIPD